MAEGSKGEAEGVGCEQDADGGNHLYVCKLTVGLAFPSFP